MDNVEFDNGNPFQSTRLSIAHMMVLTLFAGIGLAVFRSIADQSSQTSLQAPSAARSNFYGISVGLSAGGAAILFRNGITGRFLSSMAPGHWLLLAQGVMLLPLFGFAVLSYRSAGGPPAGHFVLLTLAGIVQTTAFIAAALKCERHWKPLFFVFAVFSAVNVIYCSALAAIFSDGVAIDAPTRVMQVIGLLGLVAMGRDPIQAIATIVCVCIDVAYHQRRDWLHWLGVMTITAFGIGSVIMYAAVIVGRAR